MVWVAADEEKPDEPLVRSIDPFQALAPGQTRTTSFTYTAVDAVGREVSATVDLDVAGINDQPVARDPDIFVSWEGGAGAGDEVYAAFTIDAADPEGDDILSYGIPLDAQLQYGFLFTAGSESGYSLTDSVFGPFLPYPAEVLNQFIVTSIFSRDDYSEERTEGYQPFSSSFVGYDSFEYVLTDDPTFTHFSTRYSVLIQIYET
ncbi:MAG: VCBS domain-containing protein [Geminicoccaceae bacterium]